ncbi:MAG: hypothetical protein NVS1B6_00710 [Steroidobacteraceae bacterium]
MQDFNSHVLIGWGKIGTVAIQCLEDGAHPSAAQAFFQNVSVPQYMTHSDGGGWNAVFYCR